MMKFDEDIQKDLDDGKIYVLAMLAQDMRNICSEVSPRHLNAAIKRKQKAEKDEEC